MKAIKPKGNPLGGIRCVPEHKTHADILAAYLTACDLFRLDDEDYFEVLVMIDTTSEDLLVYRAFHTKTAAERPPWPDYLAFRG